jgi:misacylated tRNA(Ala) deacylase
MELICRRDAYATSTETTVLAVDERGITLDRTVFYATGGGQPGDTGVLRHGGAEVRLTEAVKGDGPDTVIHVPEAGAELPAVGSTVEVEIDWDRRFAHMRMHTCLHLLCAVVPGAVTGGQIGADRSRLDFNVPSASLDKDELTAALNRLIEGDHPITYRWIDDAELEANPDLVRTMSVKPPTGSGQVRLVEIEGVDLQPCGGTHVARTGEIGRVEVVKIENKGKQNRRVVVALAS